MQQQEHGPMSVEQLQNGAMNAVETLCSVFSMPIEIVLRPRYGSRYFPPPIMFFAAMNMLTMPMIGEAFSSFHNNPLFIAMHKQAPPEALFGIGSLSKLFFLLCFIHGFRTYRRMFKPELEEHSRYEGPPLPFIDLLPGAKNFWLTRIVLEPALVLIAATVLQSIFIFQPGLAHYLQLSALCLTMKSFIAWYRSFQFLRDVLDTRNQSSIVARYINNTASPDELNAVHLATLPKDISPELRKATAIHIARIVFPGTPIVESKGDLNDTVR
jgi:hypothetical protein